MFCKKCGNNLPDNAKYCEKCGTSQIRPDVPRGTPHADTGSMPITVASKQRNYIIIGIIGLLFLVLIAAVFFYVQQGADFVASQKSQAPVSGPVTGVASQPSTLLSGLDGDYSASYSWDGTLDEKYWFRVTSLNDFSMLFRAFSVPLVTASSPIPHIEFITMGGPDGTISYVKDSTGTVSFPHGMPDANVISTIKSKSQENEAGVYRAEGFAPGIYPIVYRFKFYPSVEYDQSAVHLNIKLQGQGAHMAYDQVRVTVPATSVREIYFTPSHLAVTKNNNLIIATGSVAENEDLGFEVILERNILDSLPGFPVYTENVIGKAEAAYPNQRPFVP
jgi:hypothetical protein